MSLTRDEIIRLRNLGCGNEWPKVWNRSLTELCDMAVRALDVATPPLKPQSGSETMEQMQQALAHVISLLDGREKMEIDCKWCELARRLSAAPSPPPPPRIKEISHEVS